MTGHGGIHTTTDWEKFRQLFNYCKNDVPNLTTLQLLVYKTDEDIIRILLHGTDDADVKCWFYDSEYDGPNDNNNIYVSIAMDIWNMRDGQDISYTCKQFDGHYTMSNYILGTDDVKTITIPILRGV